MTKVALPARPTHLLRRDRLIDLVHQHANRKLILVSAPPGYGKTSLLVDFAHNTDLAVCWYTLDANDRDPRVFVEHLIASLARRFPNFGQETCRVLASDAPHGDGAVRIVGALINEMVRKIPDWFVIVLDDFDSVESAWDIHHMLDILLRYQPEHCCLAIASRITPAKSLLRNLAIRREMVHLGQDELRFTPTEIYTLLSKERPTALSLQEAEQLVAESEGWITGILLTTAAGRATLGLQGRSPGPLWFDYLDGEVLDRQEPQLRAFLLASSTLEEMSPVLCRETLGLSGADEWLHELERRGLFVDCLQRERSLFRFHTPFRVFLQQRAYHEMPRAFCDRHRQTAIWFESCGEAERAARHHLAADCPSEFVRALDGMAQAREPLAFNHLQPNAPPVLDGEKGAIPQPLSLHVYGFGPGRVEWNGVSIPSSAWETSSARQMLFYLVEFSSRTRQQIVDALWPDLHAHRPSGTFHNTKGRVQHALGVNPISYARGQYAIRDDIELWYDVREFERLLLLAHQSSGAVAVRYLQRAIALYTDDFLTGCPGEWCITRRAALREQYLSAIQTTADWLIEHRQTEHAIDVLYAGLRIDRLHEGFYRRLMQAYALAGATAEAIAQYRRCQCVLKRELDLGPEPDTEELYRAIREGRFSPQRP